MTANANPQTQPAPRELHLTRVLDAPRALVWDAWTKPEMLAAWWGPTGWTNPTCEIDPRPGGRIYIDTGRNRAGATVAAAYTVRARKGAPVSAPCTWDEVASGAVLPQTFTIRNMAERLDSVGDLWRGLAPARPRTRR